MEITLKTWTSSELKTLKKYYYELGPAALSKLIPTHSRQSIALKAKKLGLTCKNKPLQWTVEELEILEEFYYEFGPKQLMELLPNRDYKAIALKAHLLGLTRPDNRLRKNNDR